MDTISCEPLASASSSHTNASACRICGNTHLVRILHLGHQALTGVFPRTPDETVVSGPVELVRCDAAHQGCGLVQLRQSYDPRLMYGDNYGYRSGLNQSMVRHLEHRAATALAIAKPEPGDLILDIGSNDSTTLRSYPANRYQLVGMDPTGVKFARYYPPHVTLIPDFFNPQAFRARFPGRKARIVTSFAMFYDLEDPQAFMRGVAEVLDRDGIWVFEQSYLPSMLSQLAYDTICHEHLEYYALKQIDYMAQRNGLRIVDVELNDTNGGSFCVTVAHQGSKHEANERAIEALRRSEEELGLDSAPIYDRFRQRVEQHRDEFRRWVRSETAAGKTFFGYGASTKGNVLLQYCDFTTDEIRAIAEVNEEKFGRCTPRTHIPIQSETDVRAQHPDYLLVLPWHFRTGIVKREQPYLAAGGKLVFPLPHLEVVASDAASRAAV
ncbi:MAG: class I SAM-dependent methyltransferase [Planctomycetaceae bacterium]